MGAPFASTGIHGLCERNVWWMKPGIATTTSARTRPSTGTFRLLSGQYFVSNALRGQDVGLEEVGDDLWDIVYYNTALGRIDLQTGKITGNDKV